MVKCCTLCNMFRLKNPCSIGLIKFWLNFYLITNSKFTYLSTSRSKSPKPKNDGTLILFDHLTTKCIVEKKMYCWLTNLRMKRFNSSNITPHYNSWLSIFMKITLRGEEWKEVCIFILLLYSKFKQVTIIVKKWNRYLL